MSRRYYGYGRMKGRYYEVGKDYIRRRRPFDVEEVGVPEDEAAWATNRKRAEKLFMWHRNHGLQRREPHPMGKDLAVLEQAWKDYHAARYRDAGMDVPGCYL